MNPADNTAFHEDVEVAVAKEEFDLRHNVSYGTTVAAPSRVVSSKMKEETAERGTRFSKTTGSQVVNVALWIWRVCISVLVAVALAVAIWSGNTAEKRLCQCLDLPDSRMTETNAVPSPMNTMSTESTTESANTHTTDTLSMSTTQPEIMPATTPTINSIQEGEITLNNISLYMDCNTSIEQTCEIDPAFGDLNCQTMTTHRYLNPGEFIMDISCVHVGISLEQNGLAFILNIDESANVAECLCYVLQLAGSATQPRSSVTCGLRVTRCRALTSLYSNYTTILDP